MCHGNWHGKRGHWGPGKYGHGPSGRHFGAWFQPPVNVLENSERYELHIVAPGRSKEDFRLTINDQILSITGRQPGGETGGQEWKRQEYRLVAFERRFQLNEKIDTEGISARYFEGVLIVTLPKKPGSETPDQEIYVA